MQHFLDFLENFTAPYRRRFGVSDDLFRQMTGFLFVGLCSSASFSFVHLSLIYGFHVHRAVAAVPGFIVGLIVSYTGNSRFSFTARMSAAVLVRFTVVTLVGMGIGELVIEAVALLHGPDWLGTLATQFVVPPCNFLGHKFWTYRGVAHVQPEDNALNVFD